MDIALSGKDILKLVDGKANLVIYEDIHKYKTLDDLLGPYGACVILYCFKPKYGHWCCIFKRKPDTIEFFNSYGGKPDSTLYLINDDYRKNSNQWYPYLCKLIYDSGYNIEYNEHQFQKFDNDIYTCGRWACMRLLLRDLSLKEFKKLFKNKYGDEVVTFLTNWIFN